MVKQFNESELKLINDLIADPALDKLQAYNKNINSFSLNYASEMDHSRMIQWILNPNESHSLGTMPLKALLNACWNEVSIIDEKPDFFKKTNTTPVLISQMSLESAISFNEYTTEEYGRIDILIILPDEDIAIVIENKYGAVETKGQLENYRKWGDKNLESLSVLYLHMDATERWICSADNQWVKLSYVWLMETISTALKKSHVTQRIKHILSDYHNELMDDHFSNDSYYSDVKELYHDFSQKHAKALDILAEHEISNINEQDYLTEIQEPWSDDLRVMHWYLLNEDVVGLLLESSVNEDLKEFLESKINGLSVEFTDKHIYIHHKKWYELQKDKDDKWCIQLHFQNSKVLEEDNSMKDTAPKIDLELFFNFKNYNDEKFDLISTIWGRYSDRDKKLNADNLGKTKRLWLDRNLSHEKHDVLNIVRKYIAEINALF